MQRKTERKETADIESGLRAYSVHNPGGFRKGWGTIGGRVSGAGLGPAHYGWVTCGMAGTQAVLLWNLIPSFLCSSWYDLRQAPLLSYLGVPVAIRMALLAPESSYPICLLKLFQPDSKAP